MFPVFGIFKLYEPNWENVESDFIYTMLEMYSHAYCDWPIVEWNLRKDWNSFVFTKHSLTNSKVTHKVKRKNVLLQIN